MGADRCDDAVLEEDDPLGLVEHERAGREDDRRPSAPGLAQPAGDPRLGVSVDRARRVDEDQDLRVGDERAREHEPLPLPSRERAPALLDEAGEPFGQRVEHVLRVRDLDRRQHLRFGGAAPGVELALQRAGEKHRVGLADDDPPAHDLDGKRPDRDAAEQHAVVVHEAAESVDELDAFLRNRGDDAGEQSRLDHQARAPVRRSAARVAARGQERRAPRPAARSSGSPASGSPRHRRA